MIRRWIPRLISAAFIIYLTGLYGFLGFIAGACIICYVVCYRACFSAWYHDFKDDWHIGWLLGGLLVSLILGPFVGPAYLLENRKASLRHRKVTDKIGRMIALGDPDEATW